MLGCCFAHHSFITSSYLFSNASPSLQLTSLLLCCLAAALPMFHQEGKLVCQGSREVVDVEEEGLVCSRDVRRGEGKGDEEGG